jgi:hypothetical protein
LPSHQHPFVQQITVVQPPSSQTGSLISSCTLRRDLASAQAKPAILGPEIGLQVRSILEHPPTPTQHNPLPFQHLPPLPHNRPILTTPLFKSHGIPTNTRFTVRTHKSTAF